MEVLELLRKRALEEGIEKGREEGERLKALAIARELTNFGFSIDFIAKVTGLSVAKIGSLESISIQMGVLELLRKRAMEKGIEKGREEGEQLKALAIARELKNLGSPFDFITKVTGLSVAQIEAL